MQNPIDDRIEALCGQRIRKLESESYGMSKAFVEALFKTMLGPVEDRLIELEETVSCMEADLYEEKSFEDLYGPHITPVPNIELDRLRRIEEKATSARGEYGISKFDALAKTLDEMGPYTAIKTSEYERLLRMESAVNHALNYMHHEDSAQSECPVCILQKAAGHRS